MSDKKSRNVYSKHFVNTYKALYAKFGVDADVYPHLMREFGSQYPNLTPQKITLIRNKRMKEFQNARDEFLEEVRVKTGKQDLEMLVEAKSLNSKLVRQMLIHQEDAINTMSRLPISSANSSQHKGLLSYCVQLQTQINKFSGVDAADRTLEFRQRLIDKRLVTDSTDLDKLISSMTGSGNLTSEGEKELPDFIEMGGDEDDDI